MEITAEDRKELNGFVEISKNQSPNYVNVINSARNEWGIENLEDCVFGIVFHKYMDLSGQYLKDKMVDNTDTANAENTIETSDVLFDVWRDRVPEIKHAILEASKLD